MAMRILVFIEGDLYVRSFVTTGAIDELAGRHELLWLCAEDVTQQDEMRRRPGFIGTIKRDSRRMWTYDFLRPIIMMASRSRSRTMAIRIGHMGRSSRVKTWLMALPGVRQLLIRVLLRRAGHNLELRGTLARLEPQLVIAPTAGTDGLVHDLVREAEALNIPSLLLVNGWDNVSSKMTFPTRPSMMAVWGEQSVDQAVAIHRLRRECVFPLGVPTFDHYFAYDPAQTPAPYPGRYVLFAGCAVAFDERTALQVLDRAIEESGQDVTIVYRPHPWRHPRAKDDSVREEDFGHLVIDRQVRAQYLEAVGRPETVSPEEFLPSLDYYPGLIANAEFVVCPLSTMVVESGLLGRRVLVLRYDDEVHDLPPNIIGQFAHFDGISDIRGFVTVDRLDQLYDRLVDMLCRPGPAPTPEQIKPWLFFDERTYGQRLVALVDDLADDPATRENTVANPVT